MQIFPEPLMLRSTRPIVVALFLLLLGAVPAIANSLGEPFYITLAARIIVFALGACALNLLLGYGGLVSFGHALYVGLGAYVVGILASHGIDNGWLHLGVTLALTGRKD